jgi:hypothetical protein
MMLFRYPCSILEKDLILINYGNNIVAKIIALGLETSGLYLDLPLLAPRHGGNYLISPSPICISSVKKSTYSNVHHSYLFVF